MNQTAATVVFTAGPPQIITSSSTPGPSLQPVTILTSAPVVISTSSQAPTVIVESNTASDAAASQTPVYTTITPSGVNVFTTIATSESSGDNSVNTQPATIIITSTQSGARFPTVVPETTGTASSSSSSKSGAAALATSGPSTSTSSGLSPGGTIAVAVVVPVVAVALIVLAALFLWRRRKQKKDAEELRRKEVEEYGFNPNNDPTLPVMGGASSNGDEPSDMTQVEGAGYRGWGTTSTARKASTTLSSGNGPVGVARSTSNSDNGRYTNGSPTAGTNQSSGVESGDPLVGSPPNHRPMTGDSETIAALGAVPSNGNRNQDIHRGPSNASSAYSGAHRSDASGDGIMPGNNPGQSYYSEGMYYDEGMPQHGPYGDGSYGGGQPIIQDVPARRNTRIESPSIIPQQGSAGIAQNF